MSDSGASVDGGGQASWKPRPGNYYVMKGTWIRDRLTGKRGVVVGFPEVHESGTVNIVWYPNSSEYLSCPSFRSNLRRGRYEIDGGQHPYDKVEWKTNRSFYTGGDR